MENSWQLYIILVTYDFCENVVHPQTRWTDLSLIAPRKAITRSMANIDMFPNPKNKNFGCHYMILQLAVIYGVVLCIVYPRLSPVFWGMANISWRPQRLSADTCF